MLPRGDQQIACSPQGRATTQAGIRKSPFRQDHKLHIKRPSCRNCTLNVPAISAAA